MCGIWGICYGEDNEEWTPTELAQMAFPAIGHRGPHAFGWVTWDGVQVERTKYAGDVRNNAQLRMVELNDNAKWVIGHVRYATHGIPEYDGNNHPVKHGDIMGVHNGVLRNHAAILKETGREDPKSKVDSEAIFAAVDKWGHRGGLRRIEGDMVAVYARLSRPNTVYFARSFGRPLVLARTKANNLVFASELGVLNEVFGRALSEVRELRRYQVLRVVNGRVQESYRYQEEPAEQWQETPLRPTRSLPAAPRTSNGLRPIIRHSVHDIVLERRLAAKEGVDLRRNQNGSYVSKPKKVRRSNATWNSPLGYKDGEEVTNGMFYYNGLLLTEDQYVNAIADECGWGDDVQ